MMVDSFSVNMYASTWICTKSQNPASPDIDSANEAFDSLSGVVIRLDSLEQFEI